VTHRDGRVVKIENAYLRGSLVKFIVLPELLKDAPIFKKVQTIQKKLDKTHPPPSGRDGPKKPSKIARK